MVENGNNSRPKIALPGNINLADIEALQKVIHESAGIVDDDQNTRLQALCSSLRKPLEDPSAEIHDPNRPRVYRLGDLLDEWDAFAEESFQALQGNKPLGIKTGLDLVDAEIGGVFQSGLHSIQGSPGIGKTAFALQVAASCGFPALYVTCEMAPLELLRRIAARVTGTYLGKFKSGELEPEQAKAYVRRAIATCPNLAILDSTRGYVPAFNDSNAMNLFDIAETLRGDSPHIVVIIDSFHSWADKAITGSKEYDYLNLACGSLVSLAAALKCPILAIGERTKGAKDSGGNQAGAGTRKIAYSAESVIEIDADDVITDEKGRKTAKRDAYGEVTLTISFSKNRNGAPGNSVDLKFNGALQRFTEA